MTRLNFLVVSFLLIAFIGVPTSLRAAPAPSFTQTLTIGSQGGEVRALQEVLKSEGFYTYPTVTGYFGALTRQAVIDFQKAHALEAVGMVGPLTRSLLNGGDLAGEAPAPSVGVLARVLHTGLSGSDVSALQEFLKAQGFYTYPTITGYFGAVTEAAVRAFQSASGIESVGIVGPQTRARIAELSVPASTTTSGAVQGSVTLSPTTTLAAPTISSVSSANRQVFLSWSSVIGATGYHIKRAQGASPYTTVATLSATSYTDISILSGTTYSYLITAFNSNTESASSTPVVVSTSAQSGGTPADTTAPIISSLSSGTPTFTYATTTWTTNETADTQIEYGLTSAYTATSTLNATLSMSHSVTLTGLAAGTTYHYRARSTDAAGNLALSTDQTFTTASYDASATALFSRMTSAPDATRKEVINTLISSLKLAGAWSKLDALQVYAAADSQAASLNWLGSTATSTYVNSPTFVADRYVAGNASNAYVNTNFNPSTAGLLSSKDDAFLGIWYDAAPLTVSFVTGARTSGSGDHSWLQVAGNVPSVFGGVSTIASDWGSPAITADGRVYGVVGLQRESSTLLKGVAQGVVYATTSQTSSALPNTSFFIGGFSNSGALGSPNNEKVSAFIYGKALSSSELLATQSALATYMRAIGDWAQPFVAWGDSLTAGVGITGFIKNVSAAGPVWRVGANRGISGETAAQIATRMLADASTTDSIQIIWAGRNGYASATSTLDAIDSMVQAAQSRSGKYLVLSIMNGNIINDHTSTMPAGSEDAGTALHDTILSLNATLASRYSSNYIDVRSAIVATGTSTEIARDVPPVAMLITNDGVHLNSAANTIVGNMVQAAILAKGW